MRQPATAGELSLRLREELSIMDVSKIKKEDSKCLFLSRFFLWALNAPSLAERGGGGS